MHNVKKIWFALSNKIRFFIIGCFNFAISYGVYVFFCLLIGVSKYQTALILAWVISSFISFSAQKYLVFQSSGNWFKEYAKCCLSWAMSYLFNALLLEVCVKLLKFNVYIAQIIATSFAAVVTYILFKRFAFKAAD